MRHFQRDHLGIEALVALMRDRPDGKERLAALMLFGESLRSHIRWEERTLFESLQDTLTSEELDAAGREIEERLPKPTRAPWAED